VLSFFSVSAKAAEQPAYQAVICVIVLVDNAVSQLDLVKLAPFSSLTTGYRAFVRKNPQCDDLT
jgi:hypothetical protein